MGFGAAQGLSMPDAAFRADPKAPFSTSAFAFVIDGAHPRCPSPILGIIILTISCYSYSSWSMFCGEEKKGKNLIF